MHQLIASTDLATPLGPDYPGFIDALDDLVEGVGGMVNGRKVERRLVRVPSPSGTMMAGAALVYC